MSSVRACRGGGAAGREVRHCRGPASRGGAAAALRRRCGGVCAELRTESFGKFLTETEEAALHS